MSLSWMARRQSLLVPLILIPLTLFTMLRACSPAPEELRLVLPRLPIDREIVDKFSLLLDQEADVTIRQVQLSDPTKSELQALLDGEADLAMVSNKESFHPDIGTVIPVYPRVLHIAYRAELPTEKFDRLIREGTVYAGPPGSESRIFLEQSLWLFDLQAGDIDFVADEGCGAVIVIFAPVSRSLAQQLNRCGRYKLLGLSDMNELGRGSLIDALMLQNPRLRPFIVPRRMYGEITPDPIVTLAVDQLLVAHESVDEAHIYDLMSEIQRIQHALAGQNPAIFDDLTESFSGSKSTFALHQGTQAFLERNEPDFYERYSGIAEVLVTLIVGVVTGGFAVYRLYRVRQKDRIDEFYLRILEIRDSLSSLDTSIDSESLVKRVRELQDEALHMLIEEKLAGDESFRIFISLGNDLVDELRRQHAIVG